MRFWNFLIMAVLILSITAGCSDKNKTMTIEDYAKIESEMELPDPEIDPARVGAVVSKYGYTYEQYKDFYDKVQKDPELQEKLGDLTLKKQKNQ